MTGATQHRPGRNEPCWCGSGTKYKACHLEKDDAKEHAQREKERAEAEQEQEKHADHRCAVYRPQTHKVSAIQRPDFVVAVRNLASAGQGAWLHIGSPVDLGRDQPSVDLATAFLAQHGALADFRLDPGPPVIAATQELLDRMSGRGVFQVEPSGKRLRRYGRTEIVAKESRDGFVAYLSGRGSLEGVVQLLFEASALDSVALGVDGGILATVWPMARVTREIVRNALALPTPLLAQAPALVAALVSRISQAADQIGRRGGTSEAVLAQGALPYLVGLREAVSDPVGQLEGMGLEAESIDMLRVQLEAAAGGPQWLRELADLAAEEWDTPDGYWSWVGAARSVVEIAGLLDALPEAEAAPTLGATAGGAAVDLATAAEVGPAAAARMAAVSAVVAPPLPGPSGVFSAIDLSAQEHAAQRQVLHERLAEILDRREALARERRALQTKLQELDAEEAKIDAEQAAASAELDTQAEAEAHSRHRAVAAILARGASRLDEAAAAWSRALLDSNVDGDNAKFAQAERTVREYEDMERRGLIDQLPSGLRAQIRQQAEEARASLRDALGGREPLTVAAIVAAAEDDSRLTLDVGLPISGGDELAPGALQTVVAVAFADVLADAARSMPQIDVIGVGHERLPQGGSVLRLRFSGPPPVTADECAQFCASLLGDVGERCAALRAAGVSIEARVEPDLDIEV